MTVTHQDAAGRTRLAQTPGLPQWMWRLARRMSFAPLVFAWAAANAQAPAAIETPPALPPVQAPLQDSLAARPARAEFAGQPASADVRYLANWVMHSGNHGTLPFIVVDKKDGRVHVFDPTGLQVGSAPALVGAALGDTSAPDIGKRKLSAILPSERTTPAGRFVAQLAPSLNGDEILWVDYDSGLALHRVIATVPKERRLQRLASAIPGDRRITFGCINVPVRFYEDVVSRVFRKTGGIVYVLPESRPPSEVFGSYDVEDGPRGN